MITVENLAGQMFDAFERSTRDNGDTFVKLSADAPEWMTEVVRAAHDDMLPDDWRYDCVREACGFIHDRDGDDMDDAGHEFADDVDVYNSNLLAWVSSNLTRMSYVDDAISEYQPDSLAKALMAGQAEERREVFEAVLSALQDVADEMDDSDDEESV